MALRVASNDLSDSGPEGMPVVAGDNRWATGTNDVVSGNGKTSAGDGGEVAGNDAGIAVSDSWVSADVNILRVFTTCLIVGRFKGSVFQQFWMRSQVLSSILGFPNRSGRIPRVTRREMS